MKIHTINCHSEGCPGGHCTCEPLTVNDRCPLRDHWWGMKPCAVCAALDTAYEDGVTKGRAEHPPFIPWTPTPPSRSWTSSDATGSVTFLMDVRRRGDDDPPGVPAIVNA